MAEYTNKELLTFFGVVFLGIPAILGLLGGLWGLYQNDKEKDYSECLERRNEYIGIVVKTEEDYYKSEYGKYYALAQCRFLQP